MKDLVIIVADKNTQFALKGALNRPESLGIRPVEFEIRVHPGRDGGVRKSGPEMLALDCRRFQHGLLVLDIEGCGSELPNATALEAQLNHRLEAKWAGNGKAIVIEPEVDVWVWGSDNAVETIIDWPTGQGIRDWLRSRNFHSTPIKNRSAPKKRWRKRYASFGCQGHRRFMKRSPPKSV